MPDRSRRPLAATLVVAVVSTVMLGLAVAEGWLGPDVDRGAEFCEAALGRVRQPVNALSNLGFVVAGLLVAHRAGRAELLGARLPRGVATAYACVVVLLGPASAAMHATESRLGGHLDLLSMYLVASFAAAWATARLVRQGTTFFLQVFLLLVAACQLVGLYAGQVPVVRQPGNVAFGLLLLTALGTEVVLARRASRTGEPRADLRWGAAGLGTMAAAFVVWIASQRGLCDPGSLLQGHALWHLLGAVAAYLLFRMWTSEQQKPARAPGGLS